MSTPWSWSGGGRRQADEGGWSWKVMEMGQGTDKDEKGKKGGRTMTLTTSYKTMTLLSSKCFGSPLLNEEGEGGGKLMLNSIFHMELPSRYRRDALCVNI